MRTKLRKIGNSKGITLSKSLLEQYHFEEEVEIVTQENGLLIMPVKAKPREEWEKQFKAALNKGQKPEKALLESFSNQFDKEEWTW
ncbi:MAG: AbrB/MazE/SpoVT family DNA-binding domain-containing protein [Ferruginibacter sp.]|nr:AbrB/MazE/SpoVT family DNA-binding domain-containing protein [Chitinophagaceae bacterium]